MALIVGYAPIARTGGPNMGRVTFALTPFGLPVRVIRGCILDFDVIVGFLPTALSEEATYPLFETPGVRRASADVGGLLCRLFRLTVSSPPRAFGRSGFVLFEKPENCNAADDHDQGE